MGDVLTHRGEWGEVAVGFVYYDDALEFGEYASYLVAVDVVACGVVGTADPYHLGVLIGGGKEVGGGHGVGGREWYGAVFDIVDVCAYAIHAVGGLDGYDVVCAWLAEDAVYEVDGFVAAVAEKDVVCRKVFLG